MRCPIGLVLGVWRLAASQPTDPGVLLSAPEEASATTTMTPYSLEHGPTTQHPDMRIVIDSPDDIRPISTDVESVRSSVVFFSASLSMFALIAVVLFFRKCVTCPGADRARYYNRPPDGAEDVVVAVAPAATDAQPALSTPSKLDEAGLSCSFASLALDAQSDDDLTDVRPPTRRLADRVGSVTPEALCLQDDGSDEDEDYV